MSFNKVPILLLITCLIGSILLTACGNGGSSGSGKVPLTFWIWGSENHTHMYQEMIQRFNKIHPDISVQVENVPFADYDQKLSIAIASKTAPDIAWIAKRAIPQKIAANQLVDISQIKNDSAYNFENIHKTPLQTLEKGEQLFGIPFSTSPLIMFYNKTLFEEKNLKTPTELYHEGRWTYDEMLKAAAEITDPSKNTYGVKLVREWQNWSDALMPLIWSQGADLFTEDKSAFALNSPAGERALQIYTDMLFKDQVHPPPGDRITFESGRLGMFSDWYSNVTKARQITTFEWDIAPMPASPYGSTTSIGLAAYAIIQGTRHPEEALEFLKFVSSQNGMRTTALYFVPPRTSLLQVEVIKQSNPLPEDESIQQAVLDQIEEARLNPTHRNWARIDIIMREQIDRLYTQSASVKEVLNSMEENVNPLLKEQ